MAGREKIDRGNRAAYLDSRSVYDSDGNNDDEGVLNHRRICKQVFNRDLLCLVNHNSIAGTSLEEKHITLFAHLVDRAS